MQLVGGEQVPLAQHQVARGELPERHPGEHQRYGADGDQDPAEQSLRPANLAEHHEQEREGDEEEADVLDRVRDVDRVGRLDRVEHERGREHAVEPGGGGRVPHGRRMGVGRAVGAGAAAAQGRVGEAEHPAGDHRVERDEQVGGLAAHVHRHAEGEHGEGGERKAPGEPPEEGGDDHGPRDRHDDDRRQLLGGMPERDKSRAVPDVSHHQRRRRDQCHQGTAVTQAGIPGQKRSRRRAAGDQNAGELCRGGRHVAPPPTSVISCG